MSGLTHEELRNLNPCPESMIRVTKLMGGAEKWNGRKISAYEARTAGATFSDIVWAASAVAQNDKDVERRMRLWLADCAAQVLPSLKKNVLTTRGQDKRSSLHAALRVEKLTLPRGMPRGCRDECRVGCREGLPR